MNTLDTLQKEIGALVEIAKTNVDWWESKEGVTSATYQRALGQLRAYKNISNIVDSMLEENEKETERKILWHAFFGEEM